MPNKMVDYALAYAKRGWYVFPCREKPGKPYTDAETGELITPKEKQPYIKGGVHSASLDSKQINLWWSKWPNAMIGLNCGKSGIYAVDLDVKHEGVDGITNFINLRINDGTALHSRTPTGGMHILFSGAGESSVNENLGIDTRAEGGYIILPPSKILESFEGKTGEYKAIDDWSRTPGALPADAKDKIIVSKVEKLEKSMLDNEHGKLSRNTLNFLVEGAPKGSRNERLIAVLCDFVGCKYTPDEIRAAVLPTCQRIGLDKSEFETVLKHAMSKPRNPSIPENIQAKILEGGAHPAGNLNKAEIVIIEEALLASLVKDNTLLLHVEDVIGTTDFSKSITRTIFKTIVYLRECGYGFDKLAVEYELAKNSFGNIEDEFKRIVSSYECSSLETVLSYAHIIKEKSSLEKLNAIFDEAKAGIQAGKSLLTTVNYVEQEVARISITSGAKTTQVLDGKQATELALRRIKAIANGEIKLIETGFLDYDKATYGLFPSSLLMIVGKPGDGKSALALSLANNIGIVKAQPVAFFGLEMSTEETINRLVCQMTGVPFAKISSGRMNPLEWAKVGTAMETISNGKISFDDSSYLTIPELRSKLRKLVDKGCRIAIIDQLEQMLGYDKLQRFEQLNSIAYDLKRLAKEFDMTLVINHQLKVTRSQNERRLNKSVEPDMGDLNQAGEKPVNEIWAIVHRRDDRGNIISSKIKSLKSRNGPKVDFPIAFLGERMFFANASPADKKAVEFANQKDDGFELSDIPGWSDDTEEGEQQNA